MIYQNTLDFARKQDQNDPLKAFRKAYSFPQVNGEDCVYLCGNSLGLMPKAGRDALQQELNDWEEWGVEGHFHAKNNWFAYHEAFKEPLAKLVGAQASEVTAMNGLTTNLHLLMVSFYRPTKERYKILCEAKAFPSDQYALESQVKFHGFDPDDAIIEVAPKAGAHYIDHEDIYAAMETHKDEIALVFFGGVNYYSGQVFDMETICQKGHEIGAVVGYDLAHAAGNVPMQLHDWGVDFAAWCSYKYLNSGPGSVAGIFVHERHGENPDLPRFAGWWGTPANDRFLMKKGFYPAEGADGWQLSNAPVLAMAVHKVAIDLHCEAGMDRLTEKRKNLTAYLDFIIKHISDTNDKCDFEIITPAEPKQRGAQISILTHGQGKQLFDKISEAGVIADWREPNVIRIAPAPIYNSFEDVFRFGRILQNALEEL